MHCSKLCWLLHLSDRTIFSPKNVIHKENIIHECTIQSGCARPSISGTPAPDDRGRRARGWKFGLGTRLVKGQSPSHTMCMSSYYCAPKLIYSKTKLMAARFLRQLWRRPGLSLHLLRISGSHILGTRAIQPGQSATSIIPSRDFEYEINNKKNLQRFVTEAYPGKVCVVS